MMKNPLLLFFWLFFYSATFASGPGTGILDKNEGTKENKDKRDTEQDQASPNLPGSLRIGFALSFLNNAPAEMSTRWIRNRSVDIYYIADVPLGDSRFIFNPGLGLGLERFGFANDITLERTPTGTVITPLSEMEVNSSLLVANYVDIPLEVRFHANRLNPNRGFNMALGGKIGFLYSSHTKINFEEMGDPVTLKRKEHNNLNRLRYGITARMGIGRFNAYYFHALSPLFRGNEGPEQTQATHYKIGISFAAF
ncbi:hypothetical protein BH23BAC1_BH23BAC1_01940 [soil metagenome]